MAKTDKQANNSTQQSRVKKIVKKGTTEVSVRVEPTDTKVIKKDDGTVLIEKTDVTKTITKTTPDRTILINVDDQNQHSSVTEIVQSQNVNENDLSELPTAETVNISTEPSNKPIEAFQKNKLLVEDEREVIPIETKLGKKNASKALKVANKQARKIKRRNKKTTKQIFKKDNPSDPFVVNQDFKLGNASELLRQIDEADALKEQKSRFLFKKKVEDISELPIDPSLVSEEKFDAPVAKVEDQGPYNGPDVKLDGYEKPVSKLSRLQKRRAENLVARNKRHEQKLIEKEDKRRAAIEEKAYKAALKKQIQDYKNMRNGIDPSAILTEDETPSLDYYNAQHPSIEYSKYALLPADKKRMIDDVSKALKSRSLSPETFKKHHKQTFVRLVKNDRYSPWKFRYENSTWGLRKGFKNSLIGSLLGLLAIVILMIFAVWSVDVFARNQGTLQNVDHAEGVILYILVPLISLIIGVIAAVYLVMGSVFIVNYRYEINTYTIMSLLTSVLFLALMIFSFAYWIGYFEQIGVDMYQNSNATWITMTVLFILFVIASAGTLIAQSVIATYKFRSIPYCVTRY